MIMMMMLVMVMVVVVVVVMVVVVVVVGVGVVVIYTFFLHHILYICQNNKCLPEVAHIPCELLCNDFQWNVH